MRNNGNTRTIIGVNIDTKIGPNFKKIRVHYFVVDSTFPYPTTIASMIRVIYYKLRVPILLARGKVLLALVKYFQQVGLLT